VAVASRMEKRKRTPLIQLIGGELERDRAEDGPRPSAVGIASVTNSTSSTSPSTFSSTPSSDSTQQVEIQRTMGRTASGKVVHRDMISCLAPNHDQIGDPERGGVLHPYSIVHAL
jgi:hypothetical protein